MKLNIAYLILSLLFFLVISEFIPSEITLFSKSLTTHELLFISLFIINYLYLAAIDYVHNKHLYYELTKNSVQVMANFSCTIMIILLANYLSTGESRLLLNDMRTIELVSTGMVFVVLSIGINLIFTKKGWK